MDPFTQVRLTLGAADDYKVGIMSLSMLIHKIEGIAKAMDNPTDTVGEVWSVWVSGSVWLVSALEAAHVAPLAATAVRAR